MTDASAPAEDTEKPPKKSGRKGLIIGLLLACVGAGGGFVATQGGLFGSGHGSESGHGQGGHAAAMPDLEFVEIDPILISLHDSTVATHLRFRAQLEVAAKHKSDVAHLSPRIVDLMNGYLRALDPADFEDPMILTRIRSQLLRRVQIVAGPGQVNDVLIMEFVLS